MAAVTVCSDFGAQENKVCHCYSTFAPSVSSQEVLLVKNSPANAGDISDKGSIHGSGRYPGEGNGNPLLPGESHGQRSLVGLLQSMGLQKVRHD